MTMPRRLALLLLFVTASLSAGSWKPAGTGVDYQEFSPNPPFTYHVARVDLTNRAIRPVVSSVDDRGLTVTGFAAKRNAIVAVNGDYFDPQMMPIGLTAGPCGSWKVRSSTSTRKESIVALAAGKADILEPADQGDAPPDWSDHAISGWPVLVRGCQALSDDLPGSPAFTRAPHARTAIGITDDHKTLYLVVVDGQKEGSAGVTLPDLAAFMQRQLHVCEAMNLDGGGSSAMAIGKKLVTTPTNGAERPVANLLGIILAKDYEGCVAGGSTARSHGPAPAQTTTVEWWKDLEEILGRPGTMTGDVFKVTYPRSDLSVTVDGVRLAPQVALTSWLAFRKSGTTFMMMGDLVLTESEVAAVLKKLDDGKLQKTALHNHLLGASPVTMYLHVAGHGNDPASLAHAARQALDETATPIVAPATPATAWTEALRGSLDAILHQPGRVNGPALQYSVPRSEKISENGMTIPPAMGVASAINFQLVAPSGQAAASGDLVLIASEVDKVINQLTKSGVQVTAVHDHMLTEQPRLTFVHFWAKGEPTEIATALRRALDSTSSK